MARKSLALTALLVAAFAINLDTTIVNVALPTLVRELHASNSQLQWIVDAYNLVFAALLLVRGSLSDRFGRKGMLLAGLAVFGLASVAGGLTTTREPADRRALLHGPRRGDGLPGDAVADLQHLHRARSSERARSGCGARRAGVAIALGPIVGGWLLEALLVVEHLLRDGAGRGARRAGSSPTACRPRATRMHRAPTVPASRSRRRRSRC